MEKSRYKKNTCEEKKYFPAKNGFGKQFIIQQKVFYKKAAE